MASNYKFSNEEMAAIKAARRETKDKRADARLKALELRAEGMELSEVSQATLNLLAEKVIEFINENFDVLRFNWPAAKKIQDASELSTVLMPTSLLFKQDGTTLLFI